MFPNSDYGVSYIVILLDTNKKRISREAVLCCSSPTRIMGSPQNISESGSHVPQRGLWGLLYFYPS